MWHPYMGHSNPEKPQMEKIWDEFKNMQHNNKTEFVNYIATQFKNIK